MMKRKNGVKAIFAVMFVLVLIINCTLPAFAADTTVGENDTDSKSSIATTIYILLALVIIGGFILMICEYDELGASLVIGGAILIIVTYIISLLLEQLQKRARFCTFFYMKKQLTY